MFLGLALALAATSGATPPKLAAPGLAGFHLNDDERRYYSDHLAQQLTANGLSVVTASEIATLLGRERQAQLLGCASEGQSSCVVELANALDTDAVVTGSIGKFGRDFQVNVKIISAADGRTLGAYTGMATGENGLLDELRKAAEQLGIVLRGGAPAPIPPATLRSRAWVPMVGGAVLAGVGAALQVQAAGVYRELVTPPRADAERIPYDEALRRQQSGATLQLFGMTGLALGAAAFGTGGAMFLLGGPPEGATGPTAGLAPVGQPFASGVWR